MTTEEMKNVLQPQTFVPFRLYTSAGASIEVRRPEMAWLGRRVVLVGLSNDPLDPLFDRYVTVALAHITRIELLEPAGAA
jgi:hypothetical protein